MARPRFRYSPWDGTQRGFDFDADDLMAQLGDELAYHGDVNAALRRLMQDGFEDRNGDRVQGLRELMERIAEQRRARQEQYNLGGRFDELEQELDDIIDTERAALEALRQAANDSGDARRAELTNRSVDERLLGLDLAPSDLAGRMASMSSYEFASADAAARFEQLQDALREQLMQSYVDSMVGAVESMTPEDRARVKDMLGELNHMLDQRARGETPDFAGFMDRYGDMFPERPESLDELLEQMARRMAAMSALMASMTPQQRAQLQQLSDQLLEDFDLRWQMDQLSDHLQQAFPDAGWGEQYSFSGSDPIDLAAASRMMSELSDLRDLEQWLQQASSPAALAEVDLDRVRELVGEDAARSLERLNDVTSMLEDAGLIQRTEGRLELSASGIRRLGQQALAELFRKLGRDMVGGHQIDRLGVGHERTFETKAYEWGDPFNLDIGRTLRNAVMRQASEGSAPGSGRVRLSPEDFEIEQTELSVRSATVLMLDLSLSMPMRDNFLPAKKVVMALHSLISMQFPRDYLGIVGFSEVAHVLQPEQLPEVSWDFVYGTNMQHGFQLARDLLARERGTKQIIMITDGEPTAHLNRFGEPQFAYPPTRETVETTLAEVLRCTREGIRINTFMLDADQGLRRFVERMTELNRGRAFFTTPETLGDFVLVDFLEQRRSLLQGRHVG